MQVPNQANKVADFGNGRLGRSWPSKDRPPAPAGRQWAAMVTLTTLGIVAAKRRNINCQCIIIIVHSSGSSQMLSLLE
jgi:hypothetical protein